MATRICWKCDVNTHMTFVASSFKQVQWKDSPGFNLMAAYTCDECGFMSLASASSNSPMGSSAQAQNYFDKSAVTWIPAHGAGQLFEDVPIHIAEAASEAYQCHSINAFRASTLLARSVIEATAKEKGITKGLLITKIDELEKQGFIRPHVRDAAHEVRHFGNDMAHGDFVEPVAAEESEEILSLMAEVLNEVFQSPAKIERLKAKRIARKADPAE